MVIFVTNSLRALAIAGAFAAPVAFCIGAESAGHAVGREQLELREPDHHLGARHDVGAARQRRAALGALEGLSREFGRQLA